MQNNRKHFSLFIISVLVISLAKAGDSSKLSDTTIFNSPYNSVSMGFLTSPSSVSEKDTSKSNNYLNFLNLINQGENNKRGLLKDEIEVSGVTRFITYQRTMYDSYSDMTTSKRSISFTDYPQTDANSGANGGFPMLELNLKSNYKKDFNFNIGYSLGHNMTGDIEGSSKNIGAVQNLNFGAQIRTGKVKTSIWAGEVLWTNLSRFTMGQPQFRDNYFERVPWDWFRTSYARYQEYFTLSSNVGARNLGSAPIQGGIGLVEILPLQASLKVIYGQSNRSIVSADHGKGFPSIINGYRLEKYLFNRAVRGKCGLNAYAKRAFTDFTGDLSDNNTMGTFDFDVKVKKINLESEIGFSNINTFHGPEGAKLNYNENGFAAFFKAAFDKRAVLWPFSIEFYNISKDFGNVNSSILNQNPFLMQGGAGNEYVYNDSYFGNVSNEAGQFSNNRRGVNLEAEANLGEFKVQLGYTVSQEIEMLSDTLTIQHRVNAFSRSRFRPYYQAAGNYGRIKSYWFRTFETLTLNNNDGYLNRDLLGFNALELCLKYRHPIGKKQEIILINLSTINTIKEGFNTFSLPTDKSVLVSLLYNDLTAAYKLNNKFSLVGNFAVEKTTGSQRTSVTHINPDSEELLNNFIDQIGHMYALGVDYDLSRKTSLHLRTKYMDHKDKNFTLDKFSGFETTFELKIFL